ncbi:hypothetical protein GH714_030303 [Hevea brasiliensis]|uniref:Uncharacterized protein n=1 Tax=Hevea brasiliensis TaxID=3981 RepID=A0A6A6LC85_HEVBR|nr:hypothetical protein GH714_030303 [Hevea brasiliensis]
MKPTDLTNTYQKSTVFSGLAFKSVCGSCNHGSFQELELGKISEAGHVDSSNLVQHGHDLAILMGKASKIDKYEEATDLLNATLAASDLDLIDILDNQLISREKHMKRVLHPGKVIRFYSVNGNITAGEDVEVYEEDRGGNEFWSFGNNILEIRSCRHIMLKENEFEMWRRQKKKNPILSTEDF